MKKIIVINVAILLSVFLITGCVKKNANNDNSSNVSGNEVNNENNSKEDEPIVSKIIGSSHNIGFLKFYIKELTYENDITTLVYYITNKDTSEIEIQDYKIYIMQNNEILCDVNMYHENQILEPDESIIIRKEIQRDLTTATSIKFELIEE